MGAFLEINFFMITSLELTEKSLPILLREIIFVVMNLPEKPHVSPRLEEQYEIIFVTFLHMCRIVEREKKIFSFDEKKKSF